MIELNQVLLSINNKEFNKNELVTILELLTNQLELNTISEMARIENKSPNGIRASKRYRKINIGKQVMVIKGVRDVNSLPF